MAQNYMEIESRAFRTVARVLTAHGYVSAANRLDIQAQTWDDEAGRDKTQASLREPSQADYHDATDFLVEYDENNAIDFLELLGA